MTDLLYHHIKIKEGDRHGKIIAGGNGRGNALNQLDCPRGICLDKDRNIY